MQQNADLKGRVTDVRRCRDQWLSILVTKYDEIDLLEVFEIFCEFNQAGGSRDSQNGTNEFLRAPWNF
jgi:hypothetical protein